MNKHFHLALPVLFLFAICHLSLVMYRTLLTNMTLIEPSIDVFSSVLHETQPAHSLYLFWLLKGVSFSPPYLPSHLEVHPTSD